MMTYYKKKYDLNKNLYSNAIKYGKQNISLPIYPKLKEKEVENMQSNKSNNLKEKNTYYWRYRFYRTQFGNFFKKKFFCQCVG